MDTKLFNLGEYIIEASDTEVRATRDVLLGDVAITAGCVVLKVQDTEDTLDAVARMAKLLGWEE